MIKWKKYTRKKNKQTNKQKKQDESEMMRC